MVTTLADALPHAEFAESHSLVIASPPDRVWDALHSTRWSDLRLTKVLMLVRGLGFSGRHHDDRTLMEGGPVELLITVEDRYAAGGRVAKPWKPVPEVGPDVATLDELAAYAGAGWLKYGMDFTLHPLPGGRTRLETTTLCEPTDDVARRRFTPYWRFIRPFSGLVRRDLLRAVARRATRPA